MSIWTQIFNSTFFCLYFRKLILYPSQKYRDREYVGLFLELSQAGRKDLEKNPVEARWTFHLIDSNGEKYSPRGKFGFINELIMIYKCKQVLFKY